MKESISQIRYANQQAGFHTFDRKTLKFFGETMKNYRAGKVREDGLQEVHRTGGWAGDALFLFNPVTGECRKQSRQP